MVDHEAEFARLLREIHSGSQEAARAFVAKYGEHIQRVIRHKLEKRLRPKFDSCDFVQEVFLTFFTAPPPAEAFASPEAFMKYLAVMAQNKVGEANRQRLIFQEHNLNVEKSLEGSARFAAARQPGPDPTASAVFQAKENWEQIVQSEPSTHQPILELLRQGYTQHEIADKLGLSDRTVRRLLRRLHRRFGQ